MLDERRMASMHYVADVPDSLSRWRIVVSLYPAAWTPQDDSSLSQSARSIIAHIQTAVSQLNTAMSTDHTATPPTADKPPVSSVYIGPSDVTYSMVTIRSQLCCGYNNDIVSICVELRAKIFETFKYSLIQSSHQTHFCAIHSQKSVLIPTVTGKLF